MYFLGPKKYKKVNCSNFFVFQNWKLRFSDLFCLCLKRSFPGCFVIWMSQGEYPSAYLYPILKTVTKTEIKRKNTMNSVDSIIKNASKSLILCRKYVLYYLLSLTYFTRAFRNLRNLLFVLYFATWWNFARSSMY